MDVRRFGRQYRSPSYTLKRTLETYETYYDIVYPGQEREAGRPLRTSPAYDWHAEHGASFGEKSGWERVNYYDEQRRRRRRVAAAARLGRAAAGRRPIGVEHAATREAVALFDESSFAKMMVTGPDAADLLEWVCDNHVARDVGDVTYTQALNPRGGIESDFTVTRLADDAFLVVTGTAFGSHDVSWLRRQARRRDADVRVDDVTGQLVDVRAVGSAQPRRAARAHRRRPVQRRVPVHDRAGDHASGTCRCARCGSRSPASSAGSSTRRAEYGRGAVVSAVGGRARSTAWWPAATAPSRACGWRRATGSGAPTSRRRPNPYEAGLGFCVKLDKPGGFEGRDALRARKERGLSRRLCCLTLADPRAVALGGEPVRVGDEVVGRVTSGGYGYTVGRVDRLRLPAGRGLGAGDRGGGERVRRLGRRESWSPSRCSTRRAPGCTPTADRRPPADPATQTGHPWRA